MLCFLGEAPNYFHSSDQADFWIGSTTLLFPGNWSWTDGTSFDYQDWGQNEPQNVTSSSCAAISIASATWTSQSCMRNKPFVCDVTPRPTNPPYVSCDFGWAYFEPTGSCYGRNGTVDQHLGKVNWTTAEDHCQTFGAHLVSIHSYEEYNFVEGKYLLIFKILKEKKF